MFKMNKAVFLDLDGTLVESYGWEHKIENFKLLPKVIEGLNNIQDEETVIFHAGTKLNRDEIVTNGGRVLGVTSVGEGLPEALVKSYSAVGLISFDGMQYRKDIGAKSLN